MAKFKYQMTKLKNGLRVLLVPNKHVDSVETVVLFRVGSRCEDPKYAGISHFLEHMFFKGTKKRPTKGDITLEIDNVGGILNAFTSFEYTGYHVKVAKQHIDMANDVLSDMILYSKFVQAELDRERGVIKEEIKMYEDDPGSYVAQTYTSVLYGEQGLGRDIAGTFETVDNINRAQMVKYKEDYYSVANGLLAVVGNYDEKKILPLLNKYWGSLPAGKPSKFVKTDDNQSKPAVKVVYRDIQQANIILGWRSFPAFHPHHFVAELLSVVLGKGMSSRLFMKVREELGLCYVIGAGSDTYTDVGNFLVRTGTDPGKAGEALKMIVEECKQLKTKQVGLKEMKKIKEYWKGKMVLAMENIEFLANNVGMQELMFEKVISPEQMMVKIDEVTAGDIHALANEIFVTEKMNLAVVGPFKEDEGFKKLMKI